ncbi:MAG: uroporphyrinogen decarboxylase family protein [Bacteroidales bacterium]|jgi:uroporphyrinogen decarboxylase|nr:uroporphyrinogen decarboxylase family protein [Bacteroidales bacterium]
MNGYERINAALHGIMPDRRPVMLHNFMLAAREAGYTMKQYRDNPEIAAKCHIQFVEKYQVDGILFDVDTALIASAVGVPTDYPDDFPARAHGVLLESIEEVERLTKMDVSGDRRLQHSIETIKIMKKYFGNEIFVRGNCDQAPFSLACAMRSPGVFMMDLLMDEERSLQLIDWSVGVCRQFVRMMVEAGSDMVSHGDSLAGPDMISPDLYARFAVPSELEMIDEAHHCGVPYLVHICGDTKLILDKMATIPFDAAELDYKTPTEDIYRAFHDRITLFGTIDPSGVLALGTPQKITDEARKILNIYKGNPRLVLGAGCAIPPITPEANIRAIIRAAWDDEI